MTPRDSTMRIDMQGVHGFFLVLFLRDREPLTWIEEEHVNLALLACYNTNLLRIFQYGILVLLM